MNNKTLDKCFEELISNRGWYKNTSYDRRKAAEDKKRFKIGILPDSLKREYLKAAGYICVQPELWNKPNE